MKFLVEQKDLYRLCTAVFWLEESSVMPRNSRLVSGPVIACLIGMQGAWKQCFSLARDEPELSWGEVCEEEIVQKVKHGRDPKISRRVPPKLSWKWLLKHPKVRHTGKIVFWIPINVEEIPLGFVGGNNFENICDDCFGKPLSWACKLYSLMALSTGAGWREKGSGRMRSKINVFFPDFGFICYVTLSEESTLLDRGNKESGWEDSPAFTMNIYWYRAGVYN